MRDLGALAEKLRKRLAQAEAIRRDGEYFDAPHATSRAYGWLHGAASGFVASLDLLAAAEEEGDRSRRAYQRELRETKRKLGRLKANGSSGRQA